ncbi:MAG: hypothetical protein JEY79_16560 [Pseudodesulfovibrio sp.]|nr:hypothetical protein [Pseudodesulfovibrio sp.]
MKKPIILCILVSIFTMYGFLSYDRGVRGDLYFSETRPNIQLKIDRTLRYLGDIDYLNGRLKAHAYMWLTPGDGPGMDKMFIIEHSTVSEEVAYLTSPHLFRGLPSFSKGNMDIGGDNYQYVFYITEPKGKNFWTQYITKKGFVLNKPMLTACFGRVSTNTAWTKFYYMKTYDDQKHFRGGVSEADEILMKQFIEDFKHDIRYRGKYK